MIDGPSRPTAAHKSCQVLGLPLDAAAALLPGYTVETIAPPHGLPSYAGVFRVVRVDEEKGILTAAFFPVLSQTTPEEDTQ